MNRMIDIKEKMKNICRENNISIKELAKAAKLRKSTVEKFFNTEYEDIHLLCKLFRVLDKPAHRLTDFPEE